MSASPDRHTRSDPAAGPVGRLLSGDLPSRRARALHRAAVTAVYCAAVVLLCSSSAVEYDGDGIAVAILALVLLHGALGYLVAGRWVYLLCVLPAPCAAIVRADSTVGDITDYGTMLAFVWIVIGLPLAAGLVALVRHIRRPL